MVRQQRVEHWSVSDLACLKIKYRPGLTLWSVEKELDVGSDRQDRHDVRGLCRF